MSKLLNFQFDKGTEVPVSYLRFNELSCYLLHYVYSWCRNYLCI